MILRPESGRFLKAGIRPEHISSIVQVFLAMTLRINPSQGLSASATTGGVKRAGGDGFSLSKGSSTQGAGSAAGAAPAAGAFGVGGIDALLALQAEEDVLTGRRRRQIRRANDILDVLEDVKVSLLDGTLADATLLNLKTMISDRREGVEDEKLQAVLDHIETRALVELAKRGLS
ncbi:flagellar assembly protein FliX [Asticcacaulis machinosus]|uniref:Flagellar assembly protein FliX n=1 Tax=Asticcacaulis machinosus TaxID=2984211 RepID=A0ABT5HFP7_9CAUL|nr:flagellar assembly protein FliX [Asticcacaulis machinosus]MDC7675003.1 flagellar assembly protein FliX [Asticcacaulis machinosus]